MKPDSHQTDEKVMEIAQQESSTLCKSGGCSNYEYYFVHFITYPILGSIQMQRCNGSRKGNSPGGKGKARMSKFNFARRLVILSSERTLAMLDPNCFAFS